MHLKKLAFIDRSKGFKDFLPYFTLDQAHKRTWQQIVLLINRAKEIECILSNQELICE